MTPNPILNRCRRAFDRIVRWRRRLVLLGVISALSSVVLVSSAQLEQRVAPVILDDIAERVKPQT